MLKILAPAVKKLLLLNKKWVFPGFWNRNKVQHNCRLVYKKDEAVLELMLVTSLENR